MEFVRIVFADQNGCMKGKVIPREAYGPEMVQGSPRSILLQDIEGVENNAVKEFSPDTGDSDLYYKPVESTFCPAPGMRDMYQVVCDVTDKAGAILPESPRNVLERVLSEYKRLEIEPLCAVELEFYLVKEDWSPFDAKEIDQPYGDMNSLHKVEEVLKSMLKGVAVIGLKPEAALSESGPGQLEINFSPLEPLEMADKTFLFKQLVREVAREHGFKATFLAKPFAEHSGSGSHVHLSLYKSGQNVFLDDELFMKRFVGGLVSHTAEVFAMLAPNPNSYRRIALSHGYVPHKPTFGVDDRRAAFRQVGEGKNLRIEQRVSGSDANPYLQLAALLACGLKGLKNHGSVDTSHLPSFPKSLQESLMLFEKSDFAIAAFGKPFVQAFSAVKHQELDTFQAQITDWERNTFGSLV